MDVARPRPAVDGHHPNGPHEGADICDDTFNNRFPDDSCGRNYSIVILVFNVLSFLANVLLVNCAQLITPNTPSAREVMQKYTVILMPTPFVFYVLWPLTYALEFGFVVYQTIPACGRGPYVQHGVSIWWISTSIFQILWLYAWVYEATSVACIVASLQWVSLTCLNWSLMSVEKAIAPTSSSTQNQQRCGWGAYWCVKVPFAVHWSLSTAILILNANVLIVALTTGQLALHMMSTVLSIAAYSVWLFFSAFCIPVSGVWHCAVVSWLLFGTLAELSQPKGALSMDYPPFVLYGIWLSLLNIGILSLFLTLLMSANNLVSKYHVRSGFSVVWRALAQPHGMEACHLSETELMLAR